MNKCAVSVSVDSLQPISLWSCTNSPFCPVCTREQAVPGLSSSFVCAHAQDKHSLQLQLPALCWWPGFEASALKCSSVLLSRGFNPPTTPRLPNNHHSMHFCCHFDIRLGCSDHNSILPLTMVMVQGRGAPDAGGRAVSQQCHSVPPSPVP